MTQHEQLAFKHDEPEEEKPDLFVGSAAQIVRDYVGETDESVHTQRNGLQREAALAASQTGIYSREYAKIASQALRDDTDSAERSRAGRVGIRAIDQDEWNRVNDVLAQLNLSTTPETINETLAALKENDAAYTKAGMQTYSIYADAVTKLRNLKDRVL